MLRRLIIMRHAKSSWDAPELGDQLRPLNKRGRHDAPAVADALTQIGWAPQWVFSSDAVRTRETIELMIPQFGDHVEVSFEPSFYLADEEAIMAALKLVPNEVHTVLVLGHNPGWQSAISYFTGQYVGLTTANAALLQCDSASWSEALRQRPWTLMDVIRPKEL
ncbi:MAG: histidine phosphatase family protein [Planctomycetales bacterium]|nr:histidine phosphatase family protein [Planctomycetales bacterium]